MIYLLISGVLATNSFAQTTPILKIDQYSGHTQPQYAMEAHCTLEPFLDTSTTGTLSFHIIAKISKDLSGGTWQIETNIDNVISDADFNQVQTWIGEAAAGPFKQGTTPCDIGTVKITTENYPLLISMDCGKRIENQHPSALKLITWLRHACSLEGTKR